MNTFKHISPDYEIYGPFTPYIHQVKTVEFMLKNKRSYLFLDMGLAKTASSLWYCDLLFHSNKIKRVLVITPLSTIYPVWVKEIQTICPYREYTIVHGPRAQRIEALNSGAKFFITNTDAVRNYEKEFIKLKPDIVIIDEVTTFANHSSARSKAMQRIAKTVRAIHGLSGSPVAGGLMNSYGIAKVVNPDRLPTPYMSRYRSMIMSQITMYEYVPRPGAEKIVHQTLSPAIKYSLDECVDLPPITFEQRVIELPKVTMDLFKEMLKHQIAEYEGGIITAATAGVKAIRLLQILTGSTKTEEGDVIRLDIKPKLMELLSIYHESGNKMVIFAQSVESLKIIQEFFIDKNIKINLIYGDVTLNRRKEIFEDFQTTKEGVLIAQYRTASHGITLTASNVLVFFGPVAGNEAYRQSIRRIRRIGQTKKQVIIQLISTKFEKRIFERLDNLELSAQTLLDLYGHPEDL